MGSESSEEKKACDGILRVVAITVGPVAQPFMYEIDLGICSHAGECSYRKEDGHKCFHYAVFYTSNPQFQSDVYTYKNQREYLLQPGTVIDCGAGRTFRSDAIIPVGIEFEEKDLGFEDRSAMLPEERNEKPKRIMTMIRTTGHGQVIFKEVDPSEYPGRQLMRSVIFERTETGKTGREDHEEFSIRSMLSPEELASVAKTCKRLLTEGTKDRGRD